MENGPVIYISHPYGGLRENEEKIADAVRALIKEYPSYLFISAVHAFGFTYHSTDYQTGLYYCFWLLSRCDEMWVLSSEWENSRGCVAEIQYCNEHGIPIKHRYTN